MFLSVVILSASFLGNPRPAPGSNSQGDSSTLEASIQLNASPTFGLPGDATGVIQSSPVFGFEVGTGFVANSVQDHFFLALNVAYTQKIGETEIQMMRGGIMAGPSFSWDGDQSIRLGAGIGISSVVSGSGSGSSLTYFAMLGYFFPMDDFTTGISLNYAYNNSPITISEKTQTFNQSWLPAPSTFTYKNTLTLHDLGIKFEFQIPLGVHSHRPKKRQPIDDVFINPDEPQWRKRSTP